MSEIRGPCLNVTAQLRMSLGRPRVWVSREGALPIWGASGAPLGVCVHEPPLRCFLSSEARNHLFSALGAKPKLSLHFCRVSGPLFAFILGYVPTNALRKAVAVGSLFDEVLIGFRGHLLSWTAWFWVLLVVTSSFGS